MTAQDILKRQENNGQTEFYLIRNGQFYNSYGNGAFALARATGYRVMRRSLKQGPVLSCGFPLASLQNVKSHIRKAGGIVREEDSGMLVFYGIDGTPDETLVASDAPSSPLASCLPNPMH